MSNRSRGRSWCVLHFIFISVVVCLISSAQALGQGFEVVGTRALGMAGAFVAVADDATAVYWNPAGLATGEFFSIVGDRQTTEALPKSDEMLQAGYQSSTTITAIGTPPLGLSYYRLNASELVSLRSNDFEVESERGQSGTSDIHISSLITDHVGVSLVQSLSEGVAVGATFRFVNGSAGSLKSRRTRDLSEELDKSGISERRSRNVFDIDLGAMLAFGKFRAGLVVRNLGEPSFEAPDGSQFQLKRVMRAGLAVMPNDLLTLAIDVDLNRNVDVLGERRSVSIGAERWWLDKRIAFRSGLRANTIGPSRVVPSMGFSVRASSRVAIDGQITRGRDGVDRGWGIAARAQF